MPEHSQQKTAGELLKQTRESKRITLISVHEATKIPMDVLKAIEEGYSVRTLTPFYLKGFIKMYAEYLDVSLDKILEKSIPVLKKAMQPSKLKITQLKEKTYTVHEDDFELSRFVSKERQRQIVQGIGTVILFVLIIRFIGCFTSGKEASPAKIITEPPVVSPKEIAEKKLVGKQSSPAPSKQETKPVSRVQQNQQPAVEEEKSNKVRLAVKALKGGWLQVKVDGNVVMESTVKAGTVETWEADDEIVISGRTIHNLEFELNGKMLGTLGRQDRNARRVVITKKGLAVKG